MSDVATRPARPAVVRVLRATGWVATIGGLIVGVPALAIGASNGFDELAKIWVALIVAGGVLVVAGVAAFLGARPTRGGLIFGLIACALLLLLPPLGTVLTFVIAIVASQTAPQLRDYYGVRRRTA